MNEDSQDLNLKSSLPISHLRKIPIRVLIELTYEQWLEFGKHAQKTGGTMNRKIYEKVIPKLDRVEKALKVLEQP